VLRLTLVDPRADPSRVWNVAHRKYTRQINAGQRGANRRRTRRQDQPVVVLDTGLATLEIAHGDRRSRAIDTEDVGVGAHRNVEAFPEHLRR